MIIKESEIIMETTKKDYDGSKRQKNGEWTKNPAREKAKENNDKFFLRFCKKCNEESKWYTIRNSCVKCVKEHGHRLNLMPEVIEKNKWRHIQSKYGLNKDRYAIKLFASYDREEDGSLTFGDRTMIPLACVKKMTKLL